MKQYSKEFLRNIPLKYLDPIINNEWITQKQKEDLAYSSYVKKNGGGDSWEIRSKILNTWIKEKKFNDEFLQQKIYTSITESIPDTLYIFPLIKVKKKGNSDIEILNEIKKSIQKFLEKPLITGQLAFTKKDVLTIVSANIINKQTIQILFRCGHAKKKNSDDKTIFYITCLIDLAKSMVIIKLKDSLRKNTDFSASFLLDLILKNLKKYDELFSVSPLGVDTMRDILFLVFSEESKRAESLIKIAPGSLPPSTLNVDIKKFLSNKLHIKEPLDSKDYPSMEHFQKEKKDFENNIDKIESIFYHDKAKKMKMESFGNRYLFAFMFYDGAACRSATRNSDKENVYTGDVYWNLKDLVFSKRKISELSMYYKFDPLNFDNNDIVGEDFFAMELNIKEYKECFLIEILNNKYLDERRNKKVDYIIREFEKYFSKLSILNKG